MKLFISVKSNKKQQKVEKVGGNSFVVELKSPPVDGKANKELIEVLAEYFNTKKSNISIVSGHTSKKKIVEIL